MPCLVKECAAGRSLIGDTLKVTRGNRPVRTRWATIFAILGLVLITACTGPAGPVGPQGPPGKVAACVGFKTCRACHAKTYGVFVESDHRWMLSEVVDGQPPDYPCKSSATLARLTCVQRPEWMAL